MNQQARRTAEGGIVVETYLSPDEARRLHEELGELLEPKRRPAPATQARLPLGVAVQGGYRPGQAERDFKARAAGDV